MCDKCEASEKRIALSADKNRENRLYQLDTMMCIAMIQLGYNVDSWEIASKQIGAPFEASAVHQ